MANTKTMSRTYEAVYIFDSALEDQQIADKLSAMIESGDFPPGSYLPPERELAEQFGVSRTSVREALIALEVSGLVSVRVGDGVKVRHPETAVAPEPAPVPAEKAAPFRRPIGTART